MRAILLTAALLLAACDLAACDRGPAPAPPTAPPAGPSPSSAAIAPAKSLDELAHGRDWAHEKGADLQAYFDASVKTMLMGGARPDAIGKIQAAGYECIYGEASEKYPDPAAQCTRSFATPECQMDWEIFSTAEKGKVDSVDGSFTRDCAGVKDDYPTEKKSAIDDNLAPPKLPQTPPETPGSKPN